jgi:KipI family sensor histidine kinase inhibitor
VNLHPAGDRALLCDVDDLDTAHRLRAAIVDAAYQEVVDVVPGWRSVLVVLDDAQPHDLQLMATRLRSLPLAATSPPATAHHVMEVRYDGPDLDEVATHADLTIDEVVRRHTAATYTVAFLGFQPGFPYLAGLDPRLRTPRKETPRTRVPAGAVGIADEVTGIYPRSSPGGWQIIGTTDVTLFDPSRSVVSLLAPGDRVRFVPT